MRELPVESYKEAIIGTVRNYDFTLIYAGTGSGKSTQIPQYLSECYSQVIITKPRVMATKTVWIIESSTISLLLETVLKCNWSMVILLRRKKL